MNKLWLAAPDWAVDIRDAEGKLSLGLIFTNGDKRFCEAPVEDSLHMELGDKDYSGIIHTSKIVSTREEVMSKSGTIVAKIGLDSISFHGGSALHTLANRELHNGLHIYMDDPCNENCKVLQSVTLTGGEFLEILRQRDGLFLAVQSLGMERLSVLETLIVNYIDMCDDNNPLMDEDLKITLELYY